MPVATSYNPRFNQNPLKRVKTPNFSPSACNSLAPWWPIAKVDDSSCRALPKDHSCQVSSKSVNFLDNLVIKNWRMEASPLQLRGRFATKKGGSAPSGGSLRDLSSSSSPEPPSKREPPRFARWLIKSFTFAIVEMPCFFHRLHY